MEDKKVAPKKTRRLPSSFTILMLLTALIAVMTWVVPAGRYDVEMTSTSAGDKEVAVKGTYRTADERVAEAKEALQVVQDKYGISDLESEEAKNNEEVVAAQKALKEAEAIHSPQGLWNILLAPIKGIKEVVDIIVVVLFVGGLLALEAKVGAIQACSGQSSFGAPIRKSTPIKAEPIIKLCATLLRPSPIKANFAPLISCVDRCSSSVIKSPKT